MLVVCVVVPSSSSGARYLETEVPTSRLVLLGVHRAQRVCAAHPRLPVFPGARDVLGSRTPNTTKSAFLGSSAHMSNTWLTAALGGHSCVHLR